MSVIGSASPHSVGTVAHQRILQGALQPENRHIRRRFPERRPEDDDRSLSSWPTVSEEDEQRCSEFAECQSRLTALDIKKDRSTIRRMGLPDCVLLKTARSSRFCPPNPPQNSVGRDQTV